ncbi:Major facilitator superfamily (MFS) profile domain-containing protein [[Candida] zeylanoides]
MFTKKAAPEDEDGLIQVNEEKIMSTADVDVESINERTVGVGSVSDMSELEGNDAALSAKMRLINDAIDEIGFTPYHLKLFFLNGMGYATDSQLTFIESGVRTYVNYQFGKSFPMSAECLNIGLLAGTIFWGFGADLIGRKLAFNTSLFLSALFTIMTGAMGNFATYNIFVLLAGAAAGGNLVLDTCVFLEFLPFKYQFLLTFFALFWGIGQTVAVLITWWGMANYSCEGPTMALCPTSENQGWRYVYYVNGAIVLVMAFLRVFVVRLRETPKFLVVNNRDIEAVAVLQSIASKYNRKCSLTLESLEACGTIVSNENFVANMNLKSLYRITMEHLKVIFSTRKNMRSALLLFSSWFFLGIAYPLYSSFLPQYLASRGNNISASTTSGVYRDNVISNFCSMFGPMIAGALLWFFPILGRRGVLALGGVSTMALLFGYTAVRTHAANVGLSSAVYIAIYIYYGCLYAYSPEVMPSAARATGNAICIALTRIASCITPIIAFYSNTSSTVPIWICGAFVGIIGLEALFFPYEPSKQRVV